MTNCRAKFRRASLRLALRHEHVLSVSTDLALARNTGGFLAHPCWHTSSESGRFFIAGAS